MIQQPIQNLIEELRATGYYGSDPELPAMDHRRGTLIAAVRQLEVCVSQMAAAWLDDALEEQELWRFAEVSFFPRLSSLAEIIETASPAEDRPAFLNAWSGVRRLIAKASVETQGYGEFVVTLLIAAMVLRQLAELDADRGGAERPFVCESTNVADSFFSQCCRRATIRPLDASTDSSLQQMAERIRDRA